MVEKFLAMILSDEIQKHENRSIKHLPNILMPFYFRRRSVALKIKQRKNFIWVTDSTRFPVTC